VVVTVRDGRALRLQGNKAHPITRGFLCARTVKYLDRVYSPHRLTRPLLRRDGVLQPISWDEAIDTAARRLEEARAAAGPHAVLHYRSAGSMGLTKKLADRFWNLFGGVTELNGDFCLGAGKAALERHLGDYRAHAPADLRHSRTVVLWGRDPFTSGPHLIPPLREAIAAGASVLSINPTDLAHPDIVGAWVRVRPSGDAALALALAKVLIDEGLEARAWIERNATGFDAFARSLGAASLEELAAEAGVPEATIRKLARRLAAEGPTAIVLGTGAIRYRLGLEAAVAITMLAAVLGTIGRAGGGVTFATRHARGLDLACLAPNPKAVHREVAVSRLAEILPGLDPPVRVGWIESANPANAFGDRRGAVAALRSIPFLIVADLQRTMTTEIADLVLPVSSFVESDDVVPSWGHAYLARQRAAILPVGEARDDLAIYQALAQRLGFGPEMAGDAEIWCRRMLTPVLGEAGGWDALERDSFAMNPRHEDVPWADGRFGTASGKFEFEPGPIEWRRTPGPTREHPLTLLTPKSAEHHLSQILPEKRRSRYQVRLHPAALARRGLLPGAIVRLRSSRGAIPAVAVADASLEEGVAVLPMSGWAPDGNDVNLLTSPDTAADGVTFAYYDCFIEVEADRPQA
jgi:anaerobic selenocysteine-containing dehydrogenase